MKKTEIMSSVSRKLHKVGFKIRKHSPEILAAVGVVGTVASTVMACKATTKLSTILEETNGEIEKINTVLADPEIDEEMYSEADAKKDMLIVKVQGGIKVAKLYAPAVALGVASIGCMLGSHRILSRRNAALAAAYKAVDRGFKEYRGRVVERFGEAIDRELRYNIKAKEVEVNEVDENGNVTTVKKTIEVIDPNHFSPYAKCFDETCKGWDRDADYNYSFVRGVQDFANYKLKQQGYLFLNEVYDMLGIPRTRAGQEVGWVYDLNNQIGDNYIDFGIYDLHNEQKRYFVNGYEKSIWLDFNVDGVIADILP
jgi:hypothetical protein